MSTNPPQQPYGAPPPETGYQPVPPQPPYGQPQPTPYGQPPLSYGQPPYGQSPPPYASTIPPYDPQYGNPGYPWTPPPQYASFGQRLLAVLIDSLILSAILVVLGLLSVPLFISSVSTSTDRFGAQTTDITNSALFALGIVIVSVAFLVAFLYEPLLMARKGDAHGQTFGRRVAKIRVTSMQGGPVGTGQIWLRFFMKSLISGSIFYLGYLWMLWDPQRQTWHDKIANTYVVQA